MRWHPGTDLFQGLREQIDFRVDARDEYEARIARASTILDVGGRHQGSRSARRLKELGGDATGRITCTDIVEEYHPDLVDDITDSRIPDGSYDAVYCDAILEHVKDYWTAANHIRRILKPGGEVFIYVPFAWCFHDRMDFHRFTFTEVARLVEGYSERRLFVSDATGYGGVLALVASLFQIQRVPWLWRGVSAGLNAAISIPLYAWYRFERAKGRWPGIAWREFRYYFLHLYLAHGYCVWARK